MTQWLVTSTALPEDKSWVPSTHLPGSQISLRHWYFLLLSMSNWIFIYVIFPHIYTIKNKTQKSTFIFFKWRVSGYFYKQFLTHGSPEVYQHSINHSKYKELHFPSHHDVLCIHLFLNLSHAFLCQPSWNAGKSQVGVVGACGEGKAPWGLFFTIVDGVCSESSVYCKLGLSKTLQRFP